ncbi:MAG: methyltransferase, partial [Oscillospiraceae bacterium]
VILLEKSKIALDYSNKNAKLNGVSCTVVEDDVLAPITSHSEFDIIVSNPPYLTRKDMESLQSEVAFEPEMALYGLQNDGLLFYEKIVQNFTDRLKVGGIMAFEVGISQAPAVENIFLKNGYNSICHKEDLCGIIRIVFACK